MKLYVYEKRIQAGLSIRDLAKKSGVAKSYIQKLEEEGSGANPTVKVMCKLAKAMNIKVSCLFDCEE